MDSIHWIQIKRRNMLLFFPAIIAGAIALFWGIWYLITGNMPGVSVIVISKTAYQLPFVISRWFDIPAAAVFTVLGVKSWYFMAMKESDSCFSVASVACIFTLASVAFALIAETDIAVIAVIIAAAVCIIDFIVKKDTEKLYFEFWPSVIVAFGIGLGSCISKGGVVGLCITGMLVMTYSVLSWLVIYAVRWIRERKESPLT